MRFVHIADIHVGMGFSTASFGGEKGKDRRREIKESLMGVIQHCEETQEDLLLVAGDLFEEDCVTLSDLKDINHRFSQLTHTKVIMIAGNHDPIINNQSPYRLIDWSEQVYLFDTGMASIYLEDINTEIWGFSWNQKELPPFSIEGTLALQSDRNNILMLHGDTYQENEYFYIDQGLIESIGFDYVALGHIHRSDFIAPWMAYPGSLEPLDFSETGEHGYIEGSIEDKALTVKYVPIAKRSFHKIEVVIEGSMTFEGIYDHINGILQTMPTKDFYRIELRGDIDPDVELDLHELKRRLEERCYYIEMKDVTTLDLDVDQLEIDYKGTLIGAYIQAMRDKGLEDSVVADAMKKGLRLLLEEQVRL